MKRRLVALFAAAALALSLILPLRANTVGIDQIGCQGGGYSSWYSGALRNGTYSVSSCPLVWLQPNGHIDGIQGWTIKPWQSGSYTTYYQWSYTDTEAYHQICWSGGPCTNWHFTYEYSGQSNG